LPGAIQSVLDQTYRDVEIIVVDDGSTDPTKEKLGSFLDRITYLYQSNRGVSSARNAGLQACHGDYIAFLDADDHWYPEKLSLQLDALKHSPTVAAVFSDFALADVTGQIQQASYIKSEYGVFAAYALEWNSIFSSVRYQDAIPIYEGDIFRALFLGNFIKTSSVVIRRSAALSVAGFSPTRTTQEDYEYFLKLAIQFPFMFIDRPLLYKRERPGQLTSPERIEEVLTVSLEVLYEFVGPALARLDSATVYQRVADKHRALGAHYLKTSDRRSAFRQLGKALHYRSFDSRTLVLLFATMVPRPLLRSFAQLVKAVRS
jgi:glycosyltransferase involved in cell wall biosynthesis